MKIDIEIYIKKVISFFEENPNSLYELIGNIDKNLFYREIRSVVEKNDSELTKKQLIDIVVELTGAKPNEFNYPFIQKTAVGTFYLN